MLTALVAILAIQYYIFEGFTDAVASPAAAVGAATPASGSPASAANVTDASGSAAAATLAAAMASPDMPADDATPETTAAGPAAWKQEWSKMLRDIKDVVRGEIRQARMASVINGAANGADAKASGSSASTPATLQGLEHSANCEKDMSQYVRKDSIPCWNCTLDY